jgi:2'-5' RNA ligase
MNRYFLALLPPIEMQDYVNQVRQQFADRYNSRKAFNSPPHITLQPPFEWDLNSREALVMRLTSFAQSLSAIPITLQGFGSFPPRVIFIHVVPTLELLTAQAELQRFCFTSLETQNDDRTFKPHMTVALHDLTPDNFQRAWTRFESQSLELTNTPDGQYQFIARSLTLLNHDGQSWQIDQEIPI